MKLNHGLQEYQRKLKLGLIEKPKPLDPIEKSRQNPNSLKFAITAKCFDCSGFEMPEVTNCEMTDCPLYRQRPWQKAKHLPDKKINMSFTQGLALGKVEIKNNMAGSKENMGLNLKSEPGLQEYREKLKMGLIEKTKPLDPIEKAKQNPKSQRMAINAYCYDCCCEQKSEVKLCPTGGCSFHHLRPWQASKI